VRKNDYTVIALFVLLGLLAWVLDAVVDYLFFHNGTFLGLLITAVPTEELYERLAVLLIFAASGLLMAIARRRRMREASQESERRIRCQAERAELLVRTATRLNAQLDVDSVVNAVCEETARALDIHIATVYLYDDQRDVLCLAGGIGVTPEYRCRLQPIPRALYDETVRRMGPPVVFPDIQAIPDSPNADLHAEADTRTLVVASMAHEGRLVGTLNVVTLGAVRQFTADELTLLQGLADQAALAIANARLFAERRHTQEALQRRSAQLEVLQEVGLELTAQLDLDALLRSIVARAIYLMGAVDGGLYLYRPNQDVLERVVSIGDTIAVGSILHRGEGLSGKVWETGQPLIVDSYCSWSGRAAVFQGEPDRAVVGVAVRWGKELLGVLNVASGPGHTFSPADAELLNLLATQAAIAIRNARTLATVEEQRRRAEALAVATAALTTTLELEPLLENVLTAAIQAIPAAEKGAVLLWDESSELHVRAAVGYQDARVYQVRFTREQGYCTRAAEEGWPLLIADARADPIRYDGEIAEIRAIQSAIVAPLRYRGQVIGVLSLDNASRKGAFPEEDLHLLAIFADHAALAVENARLFAVERRRSAELEALRQASLRLTLHLELPAVLEVILEHALELVAADDAHVFLYDGQNLTFGAALWSDGRQQQPHSILRSHGLTYAVAHSGERIVITDARTHPLYQDQPWDGAIVGLPLCVGQRVLGVMNVAMNEPHQFDEDELRVLGLLADQAAIALENARLYGDLQQQMEQVKNAQGQLVQSARMAAVGELAAGVAHELNNPLTGILGFAQLLLEDLPAGSSCRHDLEAIVAAAQRACGIVYSLLDFARQGKLWKQPADLNQLLQQTLALMRIHLEGSGVLIVERYADDLGAPCVDVAQIGQVFLNLLKNAAQAMPGGGTLVLRTAQLGKEVAVAFSDTGAGISPEVQEHLFEPFFTTKPEGVGLGLAVSLGIVQEHGGRITVESQPGRGSTFTVWLPVEEGAAGDVEDQQISVGNGKDPVSDPGEEK
jgi:two-component system NtrC family sensor kinase